jgi:hypothetical protein
MARLRPNLPWPQPREQLDERGVSLPKISGDSTALPVLEHGRTLIANVGPLVGKFMPDAWKPTYFAHKLRLHRSS